MRPLNTYIDHTLLKSAARPEDIRRLCAEARENRFASVCVNPSYVRLCREELAGSGVKVCTVIGFPLGANETEVKVFELERALEQGCDEFDMVINVGRLIAGDDDYVEKEIAALKKAAKGKCLKVIIETGLLDDEQKVRAVKLACRGGADFVKTCTGFTGGTANPADVALMKSAAENGVKVKASAGIRTRGQALELIEAGADRLGTSAGKAIVS